MQKSVDCTPPSPTSLYDIFNWVTSGQSTSSCLQLFGNFIMMQRSCFKQIIIS